MREKIEMIDQPSNRCRVVGPLEEEKKLPELRRPEEMDAVLRFHCRMGWDGVARVWRSSTPWG